MALRKPSTSAVVGEGASKNFGFTGGNRSAGAACGEGAGAAADVCCACVVNVESSRNAAKRIADRIMVTSILAPSAHPFLLLRRRCSTHAFVHGWEHVCETVPVREDAYPAHRKSDVWGTRCSGLPTCRLADPSCQREPPAVAEAFRCHLQHGRGLLALVFAALHQPQHLLHAFQRQAKLLCDVRR